MKIRVPLNVCANAAALCLLVFGALLAFEAPQPAQAQSGNFSFNISPILIELNASPGSVQYFDIHIINQSRTDTATFDLKVASILERPDGNFDLTYDTEVPYSAASWIDLSAEEITIGPGEGQMIIGQVTVPRNVQGGAYAAVVLELRPEGKEDAEANAATVFRYRMATIIELTVGSRFNRRAHISSLEVVTGDQMPSLARRFGPDALLIYAALTNESNIHVVGRGTLHIRNQDGRKVREIPLGSGRGVVLPEATLNFSSILPAGLPPGTYTLQAVLNYGGLRPAIAERKFTIEQHLLHAEQFAGGPAVRFNVVPGELALQLPPRARRVESITLENHDQVPIRITSKAQPLIYDDHGEFDVVAMDDASGEIGWLEVSPAELILQPGQRRNVRVVIENAEEFEGGRYAHLAFDAEEIDARNRQAVEGGLTGRLGAAISLTSMEGHVLDARIAELRVVPPTPATPLTFEVDVVNTGNVHFQGTGTMTLARFVVPEAIEGVEFIGSGAFQTVSHGPLPAEVLQKVLPGERRLIAGSISSPLEPGLYRVTVEISQGSRLLALAQHEFEIAVGDVYGAHSMGIPAE